MRFWKSLGRAALGGMLLLACDGARGPAEMPGVTTTMSATSGRRGPAVRSPKRALLIGIDDYSAAGLPRKPGWRTPPDRGWPPLRGAVRDVDRMREMLVARYHFPPESIVTLRNQEATRDAILQAIEHVLIEPAAKDDVVFFYFAGHGSQVENSASTEVDHRDESLVPADSRLGAPDIRDKELAPLFNRILDREAHLTLVFDSCFSGSITRGLTAGSDARTVRMDARDVRDPSDLPAPESRGALVFTASTDVARAFEAEDDDGKLHGAFSLALLRAMRDSVKDETAADTFLRARALVRASSPYQDPAIAGTPAVQAAPLFSSAAGTAVPWSVAVEKVNPDGSVALHGGWAHGLTVGTVLRARVQTGAGPRIRITKLLGLGRSEGRFVDARRGAQSEVAPGALLDVVTWSASTSRPLRVWMPQTSQRSADLVAFVRALRGDAAQAGVSWIEDPTVTTPTHLLRFRDNRWELLGPDDARIQIEAGDRTFVRGLPARASLFVQVPAPAELIREIGVGKRTDYDSIDPRRDPRGVDYVLVGRLAGSALEYAWIRPAVHRDDEGRTPLPPRSDWHVLAPIHDSSILLRRTVLRLHMILAWHLLESPVNAAPPYRLAVFDRRSKTEVRNGRVHGGGKYDLKLLPARPVGPARRYYYAFGIDSFGRSVLLFPLRTVENQFPLIVDGQPVVQDVGLGGFTATPPFGVDTYVLISTEEALPNPIILESSGVRTRGPRGGTGLEELLSRTGGSMRGFDPEDTSPVWSIDRLLMHAVP